MYKMRLKDREVTDPTALLEIIRACDVIRVGMSVDNRPYIVPMNFGYEDGCFYFHGATVGRKLDMIRRNPNVCFEMDTDHRLISDSDRACDWTMKYKSIIGTGTMYLITDYKEKAAALDILMQQYGGKESYEYTDTMLERIGIMKLVVDEMTGKVSQ